MIFLLILDFPFFSFFFLELLCFLLLFLLAFAAGFGRDFGGGLCCKLILDERQFILQPLSPLLQPFLFVEEGALASPAHTATHAAFHATASPSHAATARTTPATTVTKAATSTGQRASAWVATSSSTPTHRAIAPGTTSIKSWHFLLLCFYALFWRLF
jgi:hypothetical protein